MKPLTLFILSAIQIVIAAILGALFYLFKTNHTVYEKYSMISNHKCKKCGKQSPTGAFCSDCGEVLGKNELPVKMISLILAGVMLIGSVGTGIPAFIQNSKAKTADESLSVSSILTSLDGPTLPITTLGKIENGAIKIKQGEKYGFMDANGNIIVPCIYSSVKGFQNDVAQVQTKDGWQDIKKVNIADPTAKIENEIIEVVPCIYDKAESFSEGLAMVRKGDDKTGKYGYIDKTGKEVIPCIYDSVGNFKDGLAVVIKGDRYSPKYGFIDKTGKEVIPCIYDYVSSFSEGLAMVRKGDYETGKAGFIDKTGKEVIPCIYDYANYFCDGFARVGISKTDSMASYSCGFIDKKGKIVIPLDYFLLPEGGPYFTDMSAIAEHFSEGLVGASQDDCGKWGFMDKTGKMVITPIYDGCDYFSEGLAWVSKESKLGVINKAGKEVIPFIYDCPIIKGLSAFPDPFKGGFSIIINQISDDICKYGLIDKTGKIIAPEIYSDIEDFYDGLAMVRKDEYETVKYGFIDKTGKELIPCIYNYADSFSEGLAVVWKDGKRVLIDKTGKEVSSLIYASVSTFSEGLAMVVKDDKFGFIANPLQQAKDKWTQYTTDKTDYIGFGMIGKKNSDGNSYIEIYNPTREVVIPINDNLAECSKNFATGVELLSKQKLAEATTYFEKALEYQPKNEYLLKYLEKSDTFKKDLYKLYIRYITKIIHMHGNDAVNPIEVAKVSAGMPAVSKYAKQLDTNAINTVKNLITSIGLKSDNYEYRYSITVDDFNNALREIYGASAPQISSDSFKTIVDIAKPVKDPTVFSYKGIEYEIIYSPELGKLIVLQSKDTKASKKIDLIGTVKDDASIKKIYIDLITYIICRGEYEGGGFYIKPNGSQYAILDKFGETLITADEYQSLMVTDDFETIQSALKTIVDKYSLVGAKSVVELDGKKSDITKTKINNVSTDNVAVEQVKPESEEILTKETALNPALDVYKNYYLSFLNGINALDGSKITQCTENQRQRQEQRIDKFNKDYTFENTDIVIDSDSYKFDYEDGVATVRFTAQGRNKMWERAVDSPKTEENIANQEVVVIYENGNWIVAQTIRSDKIKVGTNIKSII